MDLVIVQGAVGNPRLKVRRWRWHCIGLASKEMKADKK